MIPSAASSYYESQRNTTLEFLQIAAELWGASPPRDFDSWFGRRVDELVAAAMVGQREVISGSDAYVASVLDETGVSVAAEVLAQPAALIGVASDGRPLDSLLYGPVITAKGKIADGASPAVAWDSGLQSLAMRFHTLLADTARAATGLSIAARPRVGYVRMLVGRSCSRCAILAGRFYPYSAGFLRHPQCNCRHIPASEDTADDVRTDPQKFFTSLGEAEQDKVFTKAGAQAIRDGADINQVVNARRGAHGLDVAGSSLLDRGLVRQSVYGRQLHTTTEGMTRRGLANKSLRARGRDPKTTPRLMPEAIYELAGSREEALRLLQMNGYVVDSPVRRAAPTLMQRAQSVAAKSEGAQPEASSGGKGPIGPIGPRKPRTGGGDDDGDSGDGWHGHTRGYQHPHRQPVWTEYERVLRQKSLGIDLHGEQLYQHEVEAVERLLALGHELEWIARDSRLPTNDAIWKSNGGIEFDLKSTSAKYDAVKTHLKRSVIKARAQAVVKENFIVDLGPRGLSEKLQRQLSQYNERNPENKIVGLWVLARGDLVRIDQTE